MERVKAQLHWYALGFLFCLTAVIWYAVFAEDRRGLLTVSFLDVGQGDAIFIDSPTGVQVLLDGGPDRSVLRALSRVMPFYDRSVDALVVSNPDKDHIAGFIDILARFRVGAVIEPGTVSETDTYKTLAAAVAEEGAARVLARRSQSLDLGGGAELLILFPDRDVAELERNTGSIVAKLTYGQTSFLLMGDAPSAIERYLVMLDGKRLNADVLKVGHHGSHTSTSEELLAAASPLFAVISSGEDNRYGHPHKEVLDRLVAAGVQIFRTDTGGTVSVVSGGESIRLRK
ncbi:MAG: hypothetical protein G01um101472_420 [Parcubacteria group bacterium Gr01-1014_72]|nr:MAG: hypothetical protein G01um101472_420 [Parcubacteria group bacterium Gr01-1014_72]